MRRHRLWGLATAIVFVGLAVVGSAQAAGAHAVLVRSEPGSGVGLLEPPTALTLTLSERPDLDLTRITVTEASGATIDVGPVNPGPDPFSVSVHLPELEEGVYTVRWSTISEVDGHRTAADFAFGVGIAPAQAATAGDAPETTIPSASVLEVVGRWMFLIGLVLAIGSLAGPYLRFSPSSPALTAGAIAAMAIGLAGLGAAQWDAADVGWSAFLRTTSGETVLARGVGTVVIAIGALAAQRGGAMVRRAGSHVAIVAALVVALLHARGGHAAAGANATLSVLGQWSHLVAAGIWIGGLTTILVVTRSRTSASEPKPSLSRFSTAAAVALAAVVATGTARTIDALDQPSHLWSSGYGRTILAKVAAVGILAAFGLAHRRRTLPRASQSIAPFRRLGSAEAVAGVLAVGLAGLLASQSPPVDLPATGLTLHGADAATAVRGELKTRWDVAGPNSFVLRLTDYDTSEPVDADAVTLRFDPVDDPLEPETELRLAPGGAPGEFTGTGTNIAFDGRWSLSTLIQAGPDTTVVPFDLQTRSAPLWLSIHRPADGPTTYNTELPDRSFVELTVPPDADRGATVEFFTWYFDPRDVTSVVVFSEVADGVQVPLVAERLSGSTFSLDSLPPPGSTVSVVARAEGERRLYARIPIS